MKDEAIEVLDRHLAVIATNLGEHFDTVQIVATLQLKDGSTMRFNKGTGNMYARIGSCREWVMMQENGGRVVGCDEDDD